MAIPRELGRYELLIELARGGMAELFLGRLHGAGGFAKLVAIKRVLPHLTADKQFTEMFLNEGRIASQLSHPNVCGVFELSEVAGELFLAMEYLDGVSWAELTQALQPGELQLVTGVLAQAAEGLHYAHTLRDVEGKPTPIVHRDVSPQNLFVTVDGVCKVLDFGVSKMMTDGPRTRSGVVKGKLPYMAPEQLRAEDLDGRADVFALGACTWEALTGRRLFDRPTDFLIWKAITEEPIPPIAQFWPACPPAVETVVRRALERDREHRQATARAFADELRAAAGGASLAELADAVRTRCADRLATRQLQVATAITERRSARDPAADTLADGDAAATADIRMRDESLRVMRDAAPDAGASETLDLRSGGRDVARDGERDGGRDGARDVGRDIGRDIGRDSGRGSTSMLGLAHAHDTSGIARATDASGIARTTDATGVARAADASDIALATDASDIALVPARRSRLGIVLATLAIIGVAIVAIVLGSKNRSRDGLVPDAAISSLVADPTRTSASTTGAGSDMGSQPSTPATANPATANPATANTPTHRPSTSTTSLGAKPSTTLPGAKPSTPPPGAKPSTTPPGAKPSTTPSGAKPSTPPSGAKPSTPPTGAKPSTTSSSESGFYSVNSQPYAKIFADGKELGDTALFRVPLAAGKHKIRAVLSDGREQTFTIEIEPGEHVSSGKLTW